ncbi:inosine/uridine-preferring nucleoside hydrolase [Phlyctema vagabunda]|uniref:Inosine/uridine-preferring nucleoside hydrolase n=1 Tax=Phlyctema vagabunda TaxID=108571 RepID=A0ABR4PVD5_9HELO
MVWFPSLLAIWIVLPMDVSSNELHPRPGSHGRKKLIIDTDMLNFDDDPMAIGLANIFQRWGRVEILGFVSSVSSRYVPPGIDAINTFYGHGEIPVAIRKPVDNSTIDPDWPVYHEYLMGLTYNFPEDIRDGSNTTDPVTLYRNLLARSPDKSITIAIIGFFDNLFHLIKSGPDSVSPLSGVELLHRKVAELVVQGNDVGESFNLIQHNGTFAATVLNGWKGNLTFVPDAVGDMTYVGKRLTSETSPANPVAYTFETCIGYNKSHQAWDVAAMYYAICGLHPAFKLVHDHGMVHVAPNGSTSWNDSDAGLHSQNALNLAISNVTFASALEAILIWEPGHKKPANHSDACDLLRFS